MPTDDQAYNALAQALPLLIKLGDFIGNAEGRCEAILAVRAAMDAHLRGKQHATDWQHMECDRCGKMVRSPAALRRDGIDLVFDPAALTDHTADCSWANKFRAAKALADGEP